ncbi:hypothetical protein H4CHR_01557 [Variovorax sp. PBS-H4]|uniref:hypothetical protein n=1 Tax=Variovorax sp. PBS-H4 TaxID=434008 RepID=UPI00131681C5|nr:hypothetical protein [Variovorax sp. PBS-H4]VTU25250.1 hypothetical protein H4CHR_01557 [Variovorax sp. PBS-H4]
MKRLAGALLALLTAYLLMVAIMVVVALTAGQTAALSIAAYSFPVALIALAIGWVKADVLLRPFRRRPR